MHRQQHCALLLAWLELCLLETCAQCRRRSPPTCVVQATGLAAVFTGVVWAMLQCDRSSITGLGLSAGRLAMTDRYSRHGYILRERLAGTTAVSLSLLVSAAVEDCLYGRLCGLGFGFGARMYTRWFGFVRPPGVSITLAVPSPAIIAGWPAAAVRWWALPGSQL